MKTTEWTNAELIEFIIEAGNNTYLSPEATTLEKPYRPGCEEYLYAKGNWKYLDSYAWRKDGGGSEMVYYKDTPIWTLNYYGFLVYTSDSKRIYAFLHRALKERHPELPVRGSSYAEENEKLFYDISFSNNSIEHFAGVERIYSNNSLAYECYVHGGLVR